MEKAKLTKLWDVVIIGGGASGMMTAGTAGEHSKSVLLIEKNNTLGKKLLITGGGRCNVTNNKTDIRTMLKEYKGNDQFLFSAFTKWSVKDTISFFTNNGMEMKEENNGRMFPISNSAKSVWDVLYKHLERNKVDIHSNAGVTKINHNSTKNIFEIKLSNNNVILAKKCVIATGGTSHPETGSTGEGFKWLKDLGHTIHKPNVSLVPIKLKNTWTKKVSGLSCEEIKLTTCQNKEKQSVYKGKILFTHVGISGPTVLNMSHDVGELLNYGPVTIMLDIFPQYDTPDLKKDIQKILVEQSNKKLKNVLSLLIPSSLVGPLLEEMAVDGETFCHSVSSESRTKITEFLKSIPLYVDELLDESKAVISAGGVDLKEVNFKTMESRIVPNLYLVGDILHVDRPSGGYSLQLCWTTGYVAGSSV